MRKILLPGLLLPAFLLLSAVALKAAVLPSCLPATLAPADTSVRTAAEVMPSFRGGQQGFVRFIAKQLQYPDEARAKKVEGTVKVQFVVDEKGFCSGFKVVQGLGSGCDEEALRVLGLMPTWMPGRH